MNEVFMTESEVHEELSVMSSSRRLSALGDGLLKRGFQPTTLLQEAFSNLEELQSALVGNPSLGAVCSKAVKI